jgi:hypothetical protein
MTNHPELKTAPLIVLGFSGAGALAGSLVGLPLTESKRQFSPTLGKFHL